MSLDARRGKLPIGGSGATHAVAAPNRDAMATCRISLAVKGAVPKNIPAFHGASDK